MTILDKEQFWSDVMLVENEPFSNNSKRSCDQKDQVWRIAGLYDGEAALTIDLYQQPGFVKQGGGILSEIGKSTATLRREWMPVDGNAIDNLERRGKRFV